MNSIPLPRLFDDNLNFVRQIRPTNVSIDLNIVPLSTASIQLPESESLPSRGYVEMFTVLGSAGYFRIRSPQNTYSEGISVSELEHAVVEVGDFLVLTAINDMMTPAAAMQTLFSHYTGKGTKWQLSSDLSALGTTQIGVATSKGSVLSEMLKVLKQIPDCMMTFDFSTTPWTLGFAKVDSQVSAEGRLNRNVRSAKVTYDDSNLCTRAYYEFNGTLSHIDSDTINTYGVCERFVQIGNGYTAQEALSIVNEYIDKHKNPVVSVQIDGIVLSDITGESLDTFRLGKLFRLAMPDYNITIEEIVKKLNFNNVYGNPKNVSVSLADEEETTVTYIHKVQESVSEVTSSVIEVSSDLSELTEEFSSTIAEISDDLSSILDDISEVNETISIVFEDISEVTENLSDVWSDISEVNESLSSVYEDISEVTESLSYVWEDMAEVTETLSSVWSDIGEVSESLSSAWEGLGEIESNLSTISDYVDDTLDILDQAGMYLDSDGNIQYRTGSGSVYGMASGVTQQGINSFVEDPDTGLYSYLHQTESIIYSEVGNKMSQVYSSISQEAGQIRSEVNSLGSDLHSSITQTATQIRSEVHEQGSNYYSALTIEANQIRSEVGNAVSGVYSSITQEASQIRAEVHEQGSSYYSSLTMTANQIRSEVGNSVSGLQSSIQQQADRIGLVVEGTGANASIKAAQIAASINNGSSSVYISADHIRINGNTTVTQLLTGDAAVASLKATSLTIQPQAGMSYLNVANCINTATTSGNELKLYNMKGELVATFSKATSLSGSWSGRYYTVTAKQNNVTVDTKTGIVYAGLVPSGSVTKSEKTVYRDFIAYSDDGEGNADKVIMTKNISIDASSVYSDGWTAARNSVGSGYFPTSQPSTLTQSIYTSRPKTTVDGGYDNYQYYVTVDDDYAYIRYNSTSGSKVARVSNTAYDHGKADATVSGLWSNGTITANNSSNSSNKWYSTLQDVEASDCTINNANKTLSIVVKAKNNGATGKTNTGKTLSIGLSSNLGSKTISSNGTYTATSDNYLGYSSVTVNVAATSHNVSGLWNNGTVTATCGDGSWYSTIADIESTDCSWSGSDGRTLNIALKARNNGATGKSSTGKTISIGLSGNFTSQELNSNGWHYPTGYLGFSAVYVNVSQSGAYESGYIAGWNAYYDTAWKVPTDTPPQGYSTKTFYIPKSKSTYGETLQYETWDRAYNSVIFDESGVYEQSSDPGNSYEKLASVISGTKWLYFNVYANGATKKYKIQLM